MLGLVGFFILFAAMVVGFGLTKVIPRHNRLSRYEQCLANIGRMEKALQIGVSAEPLPDDVMPKPFKPDRDSPAILAGYSYMSLADMDATVKAAKRANTECDCVVATYTNYADDMPVSVYKGPCARHDLKDGEAIKMSASPYTLNGGWTR